MKTYTITVNGKVYDVTVEEKEPDKTPSPAAQADAAQSDAAPQTESAPQGEPAAKSAPAGEAGSIPIEAGASGKIVDILAEPGTAVSRGDTILILEVMKMETPVEAPEDGTIASVEVAKGQSVAAGALLATMN